VIPAGRQSVDGKIFQSDSPESDQTVKLLAQELMLPLHSERNVWSGSQVAACHAGCALAAVPIVSSRMPALK